MPKHMPRNSVRSSADVLTAAHHFMRELASEPGTIGRAVLLVHLVLSPLIFSTQTVENFEYSKVAVLWVASVILGAMGLSTCIRRFATKPPAEDALAALRRRARWVCREPTALGFLLFAISAAASTVTSVSPRISFLVRMRASPGS